VKNAQLYSKMISFQMKIISIVFSLLIVQYSLGQDCRTQAENKSQPWDRTPNIYATSQVKPASGESAKMKINFDKVDSWVRAILTGFTGAKVGYSNEYFLDYVNGGELIQYFYQVTGIKGHYGSTTRFWAYYCQDNKLLTEGEAGSFIYVNFNNVFFSQLTQDLGTHTVNGKFAFRVLEKSHSEGRVDYYDLRKRMNFNDTIRTSKSDIIVIRNSDKPVFIPITRKEYLQQLLLDVEASRAKQKEFHSRSYEDRAKNFEKEMQAYKLDRLYTPEKEAKRRKWFEEDQEKLQKVIDKIDPDVDGSLQVIKEYLQKPTEWLSRTVGHFYSFSNTAKGYRQYFEDLDNFRESKEDYTRSEVAYINPDYFDKNISRDVPQLIMVELVKNGYWYMYKLAPQVKEPRALTPLISFLNSGKP